MYLKKKNLKPPTDIISGTLLNSYFYAAIEITNIGRQLFGLGR